MKINVQGLIILLALFVYTSSKAQSNKVGIQALPYTLGVSYERSIYDHFSITGRLGIAYIEESSQFIVPWGPDIESVYTANIYLRYYFGEQKLSGFHCGLYYNRHIIRGTYYNYSNNIEDEPINQNIGSLGILSGYCIKMGDKISIDLLSGVDSYYLLSNMRKDFAMIPEWQGNYITPLPYLGFNLAYSF